MNYTVTLNMSKYNILLLRFNKINDTGYLKASFKG